MLGRIGAEPARLNEQPGDQEHREYLEPQGHRVSQTLKPPALRAFGRELIEEEKRTESRRALILVVRNGSPESPGRRGAPKIRARYRTWALVEFHRTSWDCLSVHGLAKSARASNLGDHHGMFSRAFPPQ